MIFNVTGGGGAALNFKVVGYATKEELLAATPAENTIGIITEIPITGYHFGTEEPSPAAAGMVWITTGTRSSVEFNALKKNAIQVYPLSAKQQDGSAWVDVTALSYQGWEWVNWIIYLYNEGDECTEITGGWSTKGDSGGSITKNSNNVYINCTGVNSKSTYRIIYANDPIDLTDIATLSINVTSRATDGTGSDYCLYICSKIPSGYSAFNAVASATIVSDGVTELDVNNIDGEYYIVVGVRIAGSASYYVKSYLSEVWMA